MKTLPSLTTYRSPDHNFDMLPPVAAAAARAICAKAPDACPSMVRTHLLSILSSAVAQLAHIADFVSKMLNLTARLAAVLHVWESKTHYVSTSCLQRAWNLVSWHAGQYEIVFVPPPPLSQQEFDVTAVVKHLNTHRFSTDYRQVPTEPIGLLLNIPPRRLRAALLRMEQRDMIELCDGKATFIDCMKMFSRSRNITWR